MSYCRWSSMDGLCDLYVYASVGDFWSLNVAGNRTTVPWSELPKMPDEFKRWSADRRSYTLSPEGVEWDRRMNGEFRRPIGLPHDGETFECGSPGECADKVEELIALGYNCPEYVAEELRAEQAEMDAASCDTHPKDGDVKQAPLVSGPVLSESEADAQPTPPQSGS